MDLQRINIGSAPNDGQGDNGREAGAKINANSALIEDQWDTLSTVAFTGSYDDLLNKPVGGGGGGVSSWTELADIPEIIVEYSEATPGADQLAYYDNSGDLAFTDVTAYGRGLLNTADSTELVGALSLGTAALSDSTDFAPAVHTHSDATTSVAGFMAPADKTKLDGVASGATANTGTVTSVAVTGANGITVANGTITTSGTVALDVNAGQLRTTLNVANGATANSADATLLARANHTGTQAISTVTGLQAELDSKLTTGYVTPVATTSEVRAGSSNVVYLTPANVSAGDAMLAVQTISGTVTIDPSTGRNKEYVTSGNVRFEPAATMAATMGVIRLRLGGVHTVTFAASIIRDEDDDHLVPDPRPWVETNYSYYVENNRMHVMKLHSPRVIGAEIPAISSFGGFFDPAVTGTVKIGDSVSANADVGDAVQWYGPAGGSWDYTSPTGTTLNLATANRAYVPTAGMTNYPVLSEIGGRVCLKHSSVGTMMTANHFGVQMIGNPNPAASPNNLPYATTLTIGAMVYASSAEAAIGGFFGINRQANSNTGIFNLQLDAEGRPSVYTRTSSTGPIQTGTSAVVAANGAIRAVQPEDVNLNKWRMVVAQYVVTTINTVEDTAVGNNTTRGTGARVDVYVDGNFGLTAGSTFSSYRGANNLGFAATLSHIGGRQSASAGSNFSNAALGRHFLYVGDLPTNGALYSSICKWLGGN